MSEPASISAAIAGRYASAIFDLAQEAGGLAALEADVGAVKGALAASPDLRDVIGSPLYAREDEVRAVTALAGVMSLSEPMAKGLALMAEKRRLFALPPLLDALSNLIAEAKGEVTADVTAATALNDAQAANLAAALAEKTGKTVKLNVTVDESLIGGMIVRLGSQMIDTSVRAKLASLQNTMKEVG